jgi:hypothetical protein
MRLLLEDLFLLPGPSSAQPAAVGTTILLIISNDAVLLSMFASRRSKFSFSQKEIHEQRHNEQRANSSIEQTNDTTTML